MGDSQRSGSDRTARVTPKKLSYIDHVLAELETIAQSAELPFFVDERRKERSYGESYETGRAVAGTSIVESRAIADYTIRSGKVSVTLNDPTGNAFRESFEIRPGDDVEVRALLARWRAIVEGNLREITHGVPAVDDDDIQARLDAMEDDDLFAIYDEPRSDDR